MAGNARRAAIIATIVLAALMLASAPAGAVQRNGRFSGCRWDYRLNRATGIFRIGIADAAADGHGCTFTARIRGADYAYETEIFVNDGGDPKFFTTYVKPGECMTFTVAAASPRDRRHGSPAPRKDLLQQCR